MNRPRVVGTAVGVLVGIACWLLLANPMMLPIAAVVGALVELVVQSAA